MAAQHEGDPRVSFTVKELLIKVDDKLDRIEKQIGTNEGRISKLEGFRSAVVAVGTVGMAFVAAFAYSLFVH